ncbi:MAG: hypothetical protein IPH89_11520 [Bacteroidetes bacterium]|nr:hypothetical protein [Bacteroidota bacterium]
MEEQVTEVKKRPQLLSILCVLTFISTGLGIFTSLLTPMISDYLVEFITSMPGYEQNLTEEGLIMLKAGWGYYLVSLVLISLSLFGAIKMWKLKRIGFHFYTIANLLLFCLPSIFLGMDFNLIGLVLPGLFIGLYAIHLKQMN